MGCCIDKTALAAVIDPMVDLWGVAASLVFVSLSSWLLLESSEFQCVFEVADFLAKKQRGISLINRWDSTEIGCVSVVYIFPDKKKTLSDIKTIPSSPFRTIFDPV